MKKHLRTILSKMCGMVGADFDSIDFKSSDWFLKYSWTQEQEKEFANWMFDYLKNNKEAQREVWGLFLNNDKILRKRIAFFIFSFGWKTSEKMEVKN